MHTCCTHTTKDYDWHGPVNEKGNPEGEGQKIFKDHIFDYYEISGEFRDNKPWNADELLVHKNGVMVLYIW